MIPGMLTANLLVEAASLRRALHKNIESFRELSLSVEQKG